MSDDSAVDISSSHSTSPITSVVDTDVAMVRKRGRPKGSVSKKTTPMNVTFDDDMTKDIQKMLLKKRIKKYVANYMEKYQRTPITYPERMYAQSQPQLADDDDIDEDEEQDEEEEEDDDDEPIQSSRAPPANYVAPRKANKYRAALLR